MWKGITALFPLIWWAVFLPTSSSISHKIHAPVKSTKIYPHSYTAAEIILTLSPEKLHSLPQGFKEYSVLEIPSALQEFDPYQRENILDHPPDLVIASPFSHPQILEFFHVAEIPLKLMKAPSNQNEVAEQLILISKDLGVENQGGEISKNLMAHCKTMETYTSQKRTLFLEWLGDFYTPASFHLWTPYIAKWGVNKELTPGQRVDKETVEKADPELIVVACDTNRGQQNLLESHPLFSHRFLACIDIHLEQSTSPLNVTGLLELFHLIQTQDD